MEEYKEIKAVVENILQQLDGLYNGKSWVTDEIGRNVFSYPESVAFKRIAGHSHSAAEQVVHIIAWRNFAVQKLTGNDDFDIKDNSPQDWPEPQVWPAIQKDFEVCHQNILTAIQNFPIEKWHSIVPLRSYSFLDLINGILEHDYYHFGQINVLLAAIRSMEK